MNKGWIIATAFALTGLVPAASAVAQSYSPSIDIAGWTVGALALGTVEGAHAGVSALHDKIRVGPGLTLAGLGEGVTLRPWAASGVIGRPAAGGVLLDLPMGAFTFTPSFGTVRADRLALSGPATVSLRSQFEVGYRFENTSRLAFGYSRTSGVGTSDPRNDADVISMSYRLPFATLLDW